MLKLLMVWVAFVAGVFTFFLLMAPERAAAGSEIYAWRTEDGGYAFSDDVKSIPARYRDQVETRAAAPLADYERFTPQIPAASGDYAEQLTARLERLRAFNAGQAEERPADASGPSRTISLRTGGENSPSLDLTPGEGEAPIVVETVYTRPSGKSRTRQSVVVRQGGKTLAIVMPRLRDTNIASDIHDEAEFLR